MKKSLLFAVVMSALCLVGCKRNEPDPEVYVDLGLPSGTLWKTENEKNANGPQERFFTYDEAVSQFGAKVPTVEQWKELIKECKWHYRGSSYYVVGPSGDSIRLSENGRRNIYDVLANTEGYYWSSTSCDSVRAWTLYFREGNVVVDDMANRGSGHSVRLVK